MTETEPTVTIRRNDAIWLMVRTRESGEQPERLARIQEEIEKQPHSRSAKTDSVVANEATSNVSDPTIYVVLVPHADQVPLLVTHDVDQAIVVAKAFNLAGALHPEGRGHTAVVLGYTPAYRPGHPPIEVSLAQV